MDEFAYDFLVIFESMCNIYIVGSEAHTIKLGIDCINSSVDYVLRPKRLDLSAREH